MYPQAKGSTTYSCGLKPVLKNDNEKTYIVDPKVFIVWKLCNGANSMEEIQNKFEDKLGLVNGKKDANVVEIISSLERIGLVSN
ncbi:MAG: hypothetical protein GF416_03425 [Candidatus Altiarchaeales archaeon]|nr:hypothetical protein [Candidatus Altiarchaeales archaeon]MBD3416170.1 hypothetical protein [Candidatus Altiarchaeales archaeon]